MAETKTQAPDLRARILADPDVVLEDREVMRVLIGAERAEGRKIVDLRAALVDRLETRLDRLETTHRSVIAAAYENLAGATQVQRAVLTLMDQTCLVDFLRVLTLETPEIVAVDVVRLCVESEGEAPGALAGLGGDLADSVVMLPPMGVAAYMALGRDIEPPDVAMRAAGDEAEAVFGRDGGRIASEALVRLDLGAGRAALLAFGAEDRERFAPEDGGDLMEFFGGVVERLLRRWLEAAA